MFNNGLLSALPELLQGLIMFYFMCKVIDFATGILKSRRFKKNWESQKMRDGLVRWFAELLGLAFVLGLDILLGANTVLIVSTLTLFIYREAGSIKENLAECGVFFSKDVEAAIEKLNKDNKGHE